MRIFIPQILPDVDKALFVDSDTYVCSGIKELYETEITDYYCAMSYNMPIYKEMLQEAELSLESGYFNTGVILLNLKAWREEGIQQRVLQYYFDHGGNFPTDDQSVINAIVAEKTLVLPYKYNAMIGAFCWSYNKFCRINTEIGKKTKEDFIEAKEHPVIVHFNGPGVRPWEKLCGHPYTGIYLRELVSVNPNYKTIMPKGSRIKSLAQYCKHRVIDPIECFINR